MNISSISIAASGNMIWIGGLLAMLILFSVLGFMAMGPNSTQKRIDAFWMAMLAFLALLTLFLFLKVSPLLAVAPVFPLVIFGRLFLATRRK